MQDDIKLCRIRRKLIIWPKNRNCNQNNYFNVNWQKNDAKTDHRTSYFGVRSIEGGSSSGYRVHRVINFLMTIIATIWTHAESESVFSSGYICYKICCSLNDDSIDELMRHQIVYPRLRAKLMSLQCDLKSQYPWTHFADLLQVYTKLNY